MLTLGKLNFLAGTRVLITGGTGTLGNKLVDILLSKTNVSTIIVYSRDEFKQFEMMNRLFPKHKSRLRFFIGDVRDGERLKRALNGVDYVIHAAALKQIDAAEYNPFECICTNIHGAENVINASIDTGVKKVVALSTDKAANPINLYGATKLCSDKLFISGNNYSGTGPTRFSVVRYGNVTGSRGSVVPFFLKKRKEGVLPVTDERMTRFWISLTDGANLVLNALREMKGGEIWVPRIPSVKIIDLAQVIAPECKVKVTGIRPGEKLHEVMIPVDEGRQTLDYKDYFIIKPAFPWWEENWHAEKSGELCPDGFCFSSDLNPQWLKGEDLARTIVELDLPEAKEWTKERGYERA